MADNMQMDEDLVLKDDDLGRGRYALTLFKIIADYAPKRDYESIGFIDLGEISDEQPEISGSEHPEPEDLQKMRNQKPKRFFRKKKQNTPQTTEDRDYAGMHRNLNDNGAFIMAVSGAWGSGKTTFVKQFRSLLCNEGFEKTSEKTEKFIKDHAFNKEDVVIFDAWKNDFYDDPLEPFSDLLIKTICKDAKEYQEASDALGKYIRELKKSAYDITVDAVTEAVSGKNPITSVINGFIRMLRTFFGIAKPEEKNLTLEERMTQIQNLLQRSIRRRDRNKVVIIVDELDRCKPTFAIQLLEIVKHLFNVKGIVFLFSLDIEQLQYCVKRVYGEGFDAIGYLSRFFNYNSLLPRGTDEQLFRSIARKYRLAEEISDIDVYYEICTGFDLTGREMEKVCSAFEYLKRYQLEGYPVKASHLYFFLLLLKNRYSDEMQKLNAEGYGNEKRRAFFKKHLPKCLQIANHQEQPLLEVITENSRIMNGSYVPVSQDGKCGDKISFSEWQPSETDSLSYVLYQKDLVKTGIENKHILEYLLNQIEAFDSVISTYRQEESITRGTVLIFGKWYKTNVQEMEPLEWIVLDRQENRCLLISKYGIDCKRYHNKYENITWAECDLHAWLNGEFYTKAFTRSEQRMIQLTHVKAEKNPDYDTDPGNDTDDNVFLLSIQEANRYFRSDEARKCMPTDYAVQQGAYRDDMRGTCWWWLRSSGIRLVDVVGIKLDGSIYRNVYHIATDDVAVRPALWVNLES